MNHAARNAVHDALRRHGLHHLWWYSIEQNLNDQKQGNP